MKKAAKYLFFCILMLSCYKGFSYLYNGHRWLQSTVYYKINPANSDSLSDTSVINAINSASLAWELQTNASFRFNYGGVTNASSMTFDGQNNVFFSTESNGSLIAECYWWYDGTGYLKDADIKIYDGGFKFYTDATGCSGGIFLEDILTHEFGHALGLGHSSVGDATMYPTMSYCSQQWRSLSSDDILGVESVYPVGQNSEPPVSPSDLTINSTSSSSLTLTWIDNSDNEQGFAVERSENGSTFFEVQRLGINSTQFLNDGLLNNKQYYYRVRAYNGFGYSSYSSTASGTTQSYLGVPTAPQSPTPTNNSTKINVKPTLSWATSNGATSYNIYLGTTTNPPLVAAGIAINSYLPSTLKYSTTYYWRVEAVNSYGTSSSTNWKFSTRTKPGRK